MNNGILSGGNIFSVLIGLLNVIAGILFGNISLREILQLFNGQ